MTRATVAPDSATAKHELGIFENFGQTVVLYNEQNEVSLVGEPVLSFGRHTLNFLYPADLELGGSAFSAATVLRR